MHRVAKTVFIIAAAAVALSLWQLSRMHILPGAECAKVFAQETPGNNLQFCVDSGKIYFFHPDTGRIFVYQTTTNRFSRLLTLEKLGEDLKQSRSLLNTEE